MFVNRNDPQWNLWVRVGKDLGHVHVEDSVPDETGESTQLPTIEPFTSVNCLVCCRCLRYSWCAKEKKKEGRERGNARNEQRKVNTENEREGAVL